MSALLKDVCCLLLCRERYDLVERSIRCFDSQTYRWKVLLIWDTGNPPRDYSSTNVKHVHIGMSAKTVGALRNEAISFLPEGDWDYIAHFDYDDISLPDRLTKQVQFIETIGKEVTGMFSMPLYDTRNDKVWIYEHEDHRYALGTSLFYKREAWERVKFPDKTPEDPEWLRDIGFDNRESRSVFREDDSPIMIQTIHGANASASIIRSSPRYREASEEQTKAVREILARA